MSTRTPTHTIFGRAKPIENLVIGHTKQLKLLGTKEQKQREKNNHTTNSPKYCNHSRIQFWQHELNSAHYTIAAATVLKNRIFGFYLSNQNLLVRIVMTKFYHRRAFKSFTHTVCARCTQLYGRQCEYVFFNAEKSS